MHIHVNASSGEAKFWMEPLIEMAVNHGLNEREVRAVKKIVEENREKIVNAWKEHFES